MDAPAAPTPVKDFKPLRFLPYWAVLQMDVHQTVRSWVYRVWVLLSLSAAIGYLLYRFGAYREAGMVQPASELMSDLLRWTVLGSVTLIIVLTAGCISAERGTMADSVLSRGISRHQYFLGKWHARLAAVLGTYLVTGLIALVCSSFLLNDDLSLKGCAVALGTVMAVLAAVISCGVAVSAVFNNTVLGIGLLWLFLYGGGFALSLLPARFPAPVRTLQNMPNILRGQFDPETASNLCVWSLAVSGAAALVGLVHFARRDV